MHIWLLYIRVLRITDKYSCQTNVKYSNIIHVNEDYAKMTIGEHDVQKYLELWGDEVEEA